MLNEIQVVCHRNEARSPFLAAFLKLHLPDFELTSSGVAPHQKGRNSLMTCEIANQWGFKFKVANVKRLSSDKNCRLHLPVDSFVQSELEKILTSEKIIKLDFEKIESVVFTPQDPVNCNIAEMKYELSRLLGFGVLQLRQIIKSQFPANIQAIFPRNPTSIFGIYSELLERRISENLIIVDASLKESNRILIRAPDDSLKTLLDLPSEGGIYTPIFEYPEPERLLCSLKWREWLSQLSNLGKVIIVTPPLVDDHENKIHDSHLGAIWAEEKMII